MFKTLASAIGKHVHHHTGNLSGCVAGFCHHFTGKQGEFIVALLILVVIVPVGLAYLKKNFGS